MLKIILELKDDRKDSGINIEVDADLVYLATNPIYGEVINSYFEQETKPKKIIFSFNRNFINKLHINSLLQNQK